MANQGFLDGLAAWGGQRLDNFGSQVADNITGGAGPERKPDLINPEEQTGKPTPAQQMAGQMPRILQDSKTMLMIGGGVVAVVAVVAMMGSK
jgi:hypothetical protein